MFPGNYFVLKEHIFEPNLIFFCFLRRAALQGMTYYTIGPGGHECAAGVAASMRVTDPAILHYRDTAFQVFRNIQAGVTDGGLRNLMRSYACSSLDPISGDTAFFGPFSPTYLNL